MHHGDMSVNLTSSESSPGSASPYRFDWLRTIAWFHYLAALLGMVLHVLHSSDEVRRTLWFQGDTLFPVHVVQDVLVDGGQYSTWRAPPAPFIFPDWFIVGAVLLVTGKPLIANLAFTVINTLIATLAVVGCNRLIGGQNERVREIILVCSMSFLFLLMCVDSPQFAASVGSAFLPAYHAGTFSFSLLAVYLFISIDKHGLASRIQKAKAIALVCIAFLLGLSDLLTIGYLAAPLTAGYLLSTVLVRQGARRGFFVLGLLWIAIIAGSKFTDFVVLREDPSNLSSVTLEHITENLRLVATEGWIHLVQLERSHVLLTVLSLMGTAGLAWLVLHRGERPDRAAIVFYAFGALSAWAVICCLVFGGACMLWRDKNYVFFIHYWMPVFFMPFMLLPLAVEFVWTRLKLREVRVAGYGILAFQCLITLGLLIGLSTKPLGYSVWNYQPPFVQEFDQIAKKYDLKMGYTNYGKLGSLVFSVKRLKPYLSTIIDWRTSIG